MGLGLGVGQPAVEGRRDLGRDRREWELPGVSAVTEMWAALDCD